MKILQFSITELENKAVDAPFYFDEMLDVSDLEASENNDIRQIDPVQVKGFAIVESSEIIFSFTINGSMILPCARTLVDVPYAFELKADEVFSSISDPDKEEVHVIVGEMLDLTPYIKENIILQMPYRVFSDEKGLQQGSGWELFDEEEIKEHQSDVIDPRLAKLQQLIDNDNQEE